MVSLNWNLQKTTVMSTVEKVNIFSDVEHISTVSNYKFLVVLITNDSYTNEEPKERVSLSKPAMANLTKIIKGLEVSTNTKVKLLQTTVFPAVLFGCKGKQIKGRLMIPWRVRRMKVSVINQIMPKHSLETLTTISKLKYFGHIKHSSNKMTECWQPCLLQLQMISLSSQILEVIHQNF